MKIFFTHKINSIGGPSTFQRNLINYFNEQNVETNFMKSFSYEKNIFVIAGTRKVFSLILNYLRGSNIFLRLDGTYKLNDLKSKNIFSLCKFYVQLSITVIIRNLLATHLIYQSVFVKDEWENEWGQVKKPHIVILNGADEKKYFPLAKKNAEYSKSIHDLLIIEGNINESQETKKRFQIISKALKLVDPKASVNIVGGVSEKFIKIFEGYNNLIWHGKIDGDFSYLYEGKIYFPIEIDPACPNSLIESLGAGCPVLSIINGSIKEIVPIESSFLIRRDELCVDRVVKGLKFLKTNFREYSINSRRHFEKNLTQKKMGENYLKFFHKHHEEN